MVTWSNWSSSAQFGRDGDEMAGSATVLDDPGSLPSRRGRARVGRPIELAGSFMHDGYRLAYTEYGRGDDVVVLTHGILFTRRMHAPLARALAASGYRVITLDLLGH